MKIPSLRSGIFSFLLLNMVMKTFSEWLAEQGVNLTVNVPKPGQEEEVDPNDPKEVEIDRKKKDLAMDMSKETEEEVTRKMGQLGKYIDPSKKLPFSQDIIKTQQSIKSAGQPVE
jgi:hypothetical protein